jgi:hypothetical protein
MERAKTSVLLVMAVGLVLLVSGANAEATTQQNSHCLPEYRRSQTNDYEQYAETQGPLAEHAVPTPKVPNDQPTARDIAGRTHSDSPLSLVWDFISSQTFFNALLTIATIFIAIFNYQLLLLDRPILVADRSTPKFFSPKEWEKAQEEGKVFLVTSARIPFRNVGKSPAIILKIVAKMKLGKDLSLPPNFADCVEETAFRDKVVPAGAESDFFAIYEKNKFCDEEWKQITTPESETKVLLYGQIVYKGAIWKKYVMSFGFVYEPPDSWFVRGNVFRFGRKEYNTIT